MSTRCFLLRAPWHLLQLRARWPTVACGGLRKPRLKLIHLREGEGPTYPWRSKAGQPCACLRYGSAEYALDVPLRLSERWKSGEQQERWGRRYPQLFDDADLQNARNQRANHFREWAVAIHFYREHGYLSLLAKYSFPRRHPWKHAIAHLVVGSPKRMRALTRGRGQPDLLLYKPANPGSFFFVEVKGPGEPVHDRQRAVHSRYDRVFGPRHAVRIVRIAR